MTPLIVIKPIIISQAAKLMNKPLKHKVFMKKKYLLLMA